MVNTESGHVFESLLSDFISRGAALGSIGINSIHNLTVPPSWFIDRRILDNFICTLIVGGKGTLHTLFGRYRLRAGAFYCIGPGVVHTISTEEDDLLQIRTIHFALDLPREQPIFLFRNLNVFLLQQIERLMNSEAVSWLFPERRYRTTLMQSTVFQILLLVGDFITGGSTGNDDFSGFIDSLEPERDYSIRELAELFGYSEKSFIRRFKQLVGITPHQYLINRKTARAKYYLANTALSIKEIALSLNYKDPYLFSRQFKHRTGISPTGFRQEQTSRYSDRTDVRADDSGKNSQSHELLSI